MKKYTPRIVVYTLTPLVALAFTPLSPSTISAPLMEVWFGFLLITLYMLEDNMDIENKWLARNFKQPPKQLFLSVMYIGLIGCLIAAISNSSTLSYIFMPFIFMSLECLFRMHEQKFNADSGSKP